MANKKTIAQLSFEYFLLSNGYSEFSEVGNESTISDYSNRITRISKAEGTTSWDEFAQNLPPLIQAIENGNNTTTKGTFLDKNDKSAIRKFYEFILRIS